MATVIEDIGTIGRDHSTIALWEANLDDDPTYDAGDDAVGECYADSDFTESNSLVVINGGGTIGLASIRLSVASAERHDGTSGVGAVIKRGSDGGQGILDIGVGIDTIVEWLEIDCNDKAVRWIINSASAERLGITYTFRRLIIDRSQVWTDDGKAAGFRLDAFGDGTTAVIHNIHNNIIYDFSHWSTNENSYFIMEAQRYSTSFLQDNNIHNNTIHNATAANGTEIARGYVATDDEAGGEIKNAICTDMQDDDYATFTNVTISHSLSSDTTAAGTGSLTEKTATNQFVSTTGGSEDLHLKSGADAIDAGTDLGTTPSGVEIDIDDRDRDAQGDTWDMGADEFVAAVAAIEAGPILQFTPSWSRRHTVT